MRHNRGYLRRMKYLKDKQRREKAEHQHGYPGIYYDKHKGRVVSVDARSLKKFVKRTASRKIRHTDDIPMSGKGFRKSYYVDNMLW